MGERLCQPPHAHSPVLGCPAQTSRLPLGISTGSLAWQADGHFRAPGSGTLLQVHPRFSISGCDGFAPPVPASPLPPHPYPPALKCHPASLRFMLHNELRMATQVHKWERKLEPEQRDWSWVWELTVTGLAPGQRALPPPATKQPPAPVSHGPLRAAATKPHPCPSPASPTPQHCGGKPRAGRPIPVSAGSAGSRLGGRLILGRLLPPGTPLPGHAGGHVWKHMEEILQCYTSCVHVCVSGGREGGLDAAQRQVSDGGKGLWLISPRKMPGAPGAVTAGGFWPTLVLSDRADAGSTWRKRSELSSCWTLPGRRRHGSPAWLWSDGAGWPAPRGHATVLRCDGWEEGKAPAELENLFSEWELLGSPCRICPCPTSRPAVTQRGALEVQTQVCVHVPDCLRLLMCAAPPAALHTREGSGACAWERHGDITKTHAAHPPGVRRRQASTLLSRNIWGTSGSHQRDSEISLKEREKGKRE